MTSPSGNEEVRYDIIVEAKAAIESLREMLKVTESNTEKVVMFGRAVLEQSKAMGVSWKQLLGVYKELNAEMSKQHKATLLGNTGGQDLFPQTQQYIQSLEDAGRVTSNVATGVKNVTAATKEMGEVAEKSTNRFLSGMHFIRIALGALEAMLLFNVINAITSTFKAAVDGAKAFEDSIYRLKNTERILSEQGQDITMQGIEDGIIRIKKLLPIFSKEDISGLIGQLGIALADLNLTEDQLIELGKAVAILNVNSAQEENLMQTGQRVISSMLTNNAKGVADLGVRYGDLALHAKAVEMGFIKDSEAVSDLTQHEKDLVKFQIVIDTAAGSAEGLADSLDNNANKLRANAAAWEDLKVTMGQVILPFIPLVTGLMNLIIDGFKMVKFGLVEFLTVLTTAEALWVMWAQGGINSLKDLTDAAKFYGDKLHKIFATQFFPEGITADDPEWFKKIMGDVLSFQDTPTGKLNIDTSEAQQNLDELKQKIEDIIQDTANAREDLQKNMNEKLADLDLEYQRKGEDAYKDYLRKLEDIDQDYVDDVAKIKKKQREDDQKDEEKYKLALWELEQRYLMDLEDALHVRDARQVLRLQRQYAFDKEALARKHALDTKQKDQDQRDELDAAKKKRDQAIQDAQEEYARKLADQRVAKQRELDDLNTWYAREQADIETAQQRKLQTLLKGWIDEQKITQQNAQKVYEILSGYFGPGGMTDQLYQYMMQSLLANTSAAVGALGGMMSGGTVGGRVGGGGGTTGSKTGSTGHGGTRSRAEGGTMVATRPTNVTFGEKGAEAALFLPLSHLGRNAGSVDLNGRMGGGEGRMVIRLDLSPDLEARVIENSLNGVADVITQINRSKL